MEPVTDTEIKPVKNTFMCQSGYKDSLRIGKAFGTKTKITLVMSENGEFKGNVIISKKQARRMIKVLEEKING